VDTFTKHERSAIMRRVRSTDNVSTERTFVASLRASHIVGWKLRPSQLRGKPDIYFPRQRVVVFLDGCFWHGCPRCFRAPSSRRKYWKPKIENNRKRDQNISRQLRRQGFRVLRIWEHDISGPRGIKRLLKMISPQNFATQKTVSPA
jgi:DNA mismatch endonuclease (patch repair protein)